MIAVSNDMNFTDSQIGALHCVPSEETMKEIGKRSFFKNKVPLKSILNLISKEMYDTLSILSAH